MTNIHLPGVLLPALVCLAVMAGCEHAQPAETVAPIDTRVHIVGWEPAGNAFWEGEEKTSGITELVRCGNNLFVERDNGMIYTASIPELHWEQLHLPDDALVYGGWGQLCSDDEHVWCITREEKLLEYDVIHKTFTNLVPDLSVFGDTLGDTAEMELQGLGLFQGHLYMSVHDYSTDPWFIRIFRYRSGGGWERCDSGWRGIHNQSRVPQQFFPSAAGLWATTGQEGLMCFDGSVWRETPGTNVANGIGDSLIGLYASYVTDYNGEYFIGTKNNGIWRLSPDGKQTKDPGVLIHYYPTGIYDTLTDLEEIYTLLNHKGLLVSPQLNCYRDNSDNYWKQMTVDSGDTVWQRYDGEDSYGFIYPVYYFSSASVSYGDTIFATASEEEGTKGAVFMFDLNKIAWYRSYKANGYRF